MNKFIPLSAILICTSALASQPEEGNKVSVGPQTITFNTDGPHVVTGPVARIGPNGPEVIPAHVVSVDANNIDTQRAEKLRKLQERLGVQLEAMAARRNIQVPGAQGHSVIAVGLDGVDLAGVKKVTIPVVRAVAYSFEFGAQPAEPQVRSSVPQEGVLYVDPTVTRTASEVKAIGFAGPVPEGTKEIVITGPVEARGGSYYFKNNDESEGTFDDGEE